MKYVFFFALTVCAQAELPRRIAIIGCHQQDKPSPALASYVAARPDVCLWIGDNVYADTTEDPEHVRRCHEVLAAKPDFLRLKLACEFLPTWDDHDFGLNDAGGSYIFKKQTKAIWRDFWEMEDRVPADQAGIYYERRYAEGGTSLQILLLDPRYNRAEPKSGGDTLGETQWAWLAAKLREPATLRLIVSGYQILLDPDTGSETWAHFPEARERLFRTIREAKADGVVFLTGDQHYGEVLRVRDAIGYDAIELQFAGINQNEAPELATHRVSPSAVSLNSMGLIDLHWRTDAHQHPHLLFTVTDTDTGQKEIAYRVNFSELRTKP
jgi:alkaline phosphatase D